MSACALPSRDEPRRDDAQVSFIKARQSPTPELLRAPDRASIAQTAAQAERFARALQRGGAAGIEAGRLDPSELPLLHGAPEGIAFRAMGPSRALALGDPAPRCPARAAAPGPSSAAAAEAALAACFDRLEAAGAAAPDCGCRIVAADASILGSRADFAYAPGVFARLISPALGLDLDLAATEAADPDGPPGARRLELRPAPGGTAVLHISPDGEARLRWGGDLWQGRRTAHGLARGRYRERFFLRRADGARLVLAAGWDPVAFAVEREALLRPPGPAAGLPSAALSP